MTAGAISKLRHPAPDDLELYALGRLGHDNDQTIEEHLLVCGSCRRLLDETGSEIGAIKAAFLVFDWEHQTPDGPVRVWVQSAPNGWAGRIEGAQVQSLRIEVSAETATFGCISRFGEMFPEHSCGDACRSRIEPVPVSEQDQPKIHRVQKSLH